MNLTATQVVTRALRAAKVLGFDEAPSVFTLNEGLLQLQLLLDQWKADGHLHFAPDHLLPTFVDLTTPVAVPDGFANALSGSLAFLIAGENGSMVSKEVTDATIAGLNLRRIKLAALQVPKTSSDAIYSLGQNREHYDIFAG